MKVYRIYRTVTSVQYTFIEANSRDDATHEAMWNPHLHEWHLSSVNDAELLSVEEAVQ
jgi:hypothetical protein